MQRFRIIGMAILAIFAIGAVAAATASAEELRLLPLGTTANPVKFNVSSAGGELGSEVAKITCVKDKGTGETTSARLGKFRVTFEECKNVASGAACRGLSDLPGNITAEGEFHLRRLLGTEAEQKHIVVFFLLKEVHFSCSIVLVKVTGCVAGLIEPINKLAKELTIKLTVSGGKQVILEADTDGELTGMEKCGPLQVSVNEAAPANGTESTTETMSGFTQGGTAVEALLMA